MLEKAPHLEQGGNTDVSNEERREIEAVLRKLKTMNPDGYRAFLRLIREVEKISS